MTTGEMPNNLPAEQAVIGAILLDNNIYDRIDTRLLPEHFYDPVHGEIYKTIVRMLGRGLLVSPVTLRSIFKNFDQEQQPIDEYLCNLADGVISIECANDFALIVFDCHIRRTLLTISAGVTAAAANPVEPLAGESQIEAAEHQLFNLAERGLISSGVKKFDTILAETMEQARLARLSPNGLSGTSTGLIDLDKITGGIQKSDLVIIAGRPSMGKTALATNIAFEAAAKQNVPTVFFSLEMSGTQLGARILSSAANLSSAVIRKGAITDSQMKQLAGACGQIEQAPFYIDDTAGLSMSQLTARCRRHKRMYGVGLIVVDYLQLLSLGKADRQENRVQELSLITRQLKVIAKDLDIPVIALSQLSRAVEQRENKRPILSDLRESGSIEQDADVVMFVYRDEYYVAATEPGDKVDGKVRADWLDEMARVRGLAEISVMKQRQGPTGRVTCQFDSELTQFNNLEKG